MTGMRTFRDAKAMAKTLRAEVLAGTQIDLSHSQCLEIVAHQFGLADWNVLAAKIEDGGPDEPTQWRTAFAAATTIPVLRIFSERAARRFYLDFLGFTMDFGGPASGGDSPFYGQVSRPGATLHLSEGPYDAGPGATVDIWITGVDDYRNELLTKDLGVFGPALGVPPIGEVYWGARVLTIPDPFGNHLRISEPTDPAAHTNLPRWAAS
jgi:catechol 2,3-dioxygenase-like lactoylglutathione lyase family enzyme